MADGMMMMMMGKSISAFKVETHSRQKSPIRCKPTIVNICVYFDRIIYTVRL